VELKKTTNEYREFQKQFSKKKWAIMKGMTLDDLAAEEAAAAAGSGPETTGGTTGVDAARVPEASDLTNVLDSLNKVTAAIIIRTRTFTTAPPFSLQRLVPTTNPLNATHLHIQLANLEKRITSLEGNNEYERMVKHNRTPVQERTSFEFKKKREMANQGGAKQMVYTIRPKRTQYGTSSGAGAGSGVNAVRGRRGSKGTGGGGGGGGGDGNTFLTGGDFGTGGGGKAMSREDRARERQRALHDATPGQKQMRGRLQARKAKAKEETAGQRRHQTAMDELARRKREQGSRAKAKTWGDRINKQNMPSRTTKGASAGIRTKNKHMQDFQNQKNQHAKRRDDMAKSTLNRVNTKMKGKANSYGTVGSRTAPVGRGGSRGPSTVSKRGTSTRRSAGGTAPARRARTGGGEMPLPMGSGIAVSGVGGLRALRGSKGGPKGPVRGRGMAPSNNQRSSRGY